MKEKIVTGTNDRPKDATIAETGKDLPPRVIEVDTEGVAAVHEHHGNEQPGNETVKVNQELDDAFREGDPDMVPSEKPIGGPPD